MKEFQRKQKLRKRVYSKTAIFILLIISILIGKGLINIYSKEKDSRIEVERLTKQKNEIESRLAAVSKSAEMLNSEIGIEAEIRNKFDVVKSGEQVIVVVDKEIPPEPEEKQNFLKKFWGGVTGVFRKDKTDESESGSTSTAKQSEEQSEDSDTDW